VFEAKFLNGFTHYVNILFTSYISKSVGGTDLLGYTNRASSVTLTPASSCMTKFDTELRVYLTYGRTKNKW
jgi:hypothetical protein